MREVLLVTTEYISNVVWLTISAAICIQKHKAVYSYLSGLMWCHEKSAEEIPVTTKDPVLQYVTWEWVWHLEKFAKYLFFHWFWLLQEANIYNAFFNVFVKLSGYITNWKNYSSFLKPVSDSIISALCFKVRALQSRSEMWLHRTSWCNTGVLSN